MLSTYRDFLNYPCHRSLSWHHSRLYSAVCHLVSYQTSTEDRLLLFLDTEHTEQLLRDDRCFGISGNNANRATLAWFAQNCVSREADSVSLKLKTITHNTFISHQLRFHAMLHINDVSTTSTVRAVQATWPSEEPKIKVLLTNLQKVAEIAPTTLGD